MNEPFTYSYSAHVADVHAPGFGTVQEGLFATGTTDPKTTLKVNGDEKNSTAKKANPPLKGEQMDEFKYPYLVTHNQLLAHAKAVKVFRDKYQVHILILLIVYFTSTK